MRVRLVSIALIASFLAANVAAAATSPQVQQHAKKHSGHHGAKKHPHQHSGAHKKGSTPHTAQ